MTLLTTAQKSKLWFSNSHVWMWELNHKEGSVLRNYCFGIGELEKTPASPLNCKEIKTVNPKGNCPQYSLKAQCWSWSSSILWLTDAKSQLTGKRPWSWKRLKAKAEGGRRCLTVYQWTWIWTNSRKQWKTGEPGVPTVNGVEMSWTRLSDWTTTKY